MLYWEGVTISIFLPNGTPLVVSLFPNHSIKLWHKHTPPLSKWPSGHAKREGQWILFLFCGRDIFCASWIRSDTVSALLILSCVAIVNEPWTQSSYRISTAWVVFNSDANKPDNNAWDPLFLGGIMVKKTYNQEDFRNIKSWLSAEGLSMPCRLGWTWYVVGIEGSPA